MASTRYPKGYNKKGKAPAKKKHTPTGGVAAYRATIKNKQNAYYQKKEKARDDREAYRPLKHSNRRSK